MKEGKTGGEDKGQKDRGRKVRPRNEGGLLHLHSPPAAELEAGQEPTALPLVLLLVHLENFSLANSRLSLALKDLRKQLSVCKLYDVFFTWFNQD